MLRFQVHCLKQRDKKSISMTMDSGHEQVLIVVRRRRSIGTRGGKLVDAIDSWYF